MGAKTWLGAREAAEALGVTLATLYAYVSRGQVRSEPDPGGGEGAKARRYRAEDVEALVKRREQRRNPARAAEEALDWGAPVLESAITAIAGGRLSYRGRDAVAMAASEPLEAVAAWLWAGETGGSPGWAAGLPPRAAALAETLGHLRPFERFQVLVPLAGAEDLAGADLRPEALLRAGGRLMGWLGAIAAGEGEGPLAQRLAVSWAGGGAPVARGASRRPAQGLLDEAAMVKVLSLSLGLCADHELNVSSFAARCVASAGAPLHAAVSAGLAALSGARHGGHTARVSALLREAEAEGPEACVVGRLRRGEPVPGFGHPLYPDGDPRGAALLAALAEAFPGGAALPLALAAAAEAVLGGRPTIDFGLAAVERGLGLPAGSALVLFALGRATGWIAHALEEYPTGRLIRPRARYVGPTPGA